MAILFRGEFHSLVLSTSHRLSIYASHDN